MKQNDLIKNRIINKTILFATIIILVCLGACAPKHSSYTDFKDIDEAGWIRKNPLYFTPEYADSTVNYDVFITVRHDNYYSFRNLWMFVDYVDNFNKIERDTINFVLADEYGNWHSKGFGSMFQYEMKVKSAISPGSITKIGLWQGMRKDSITHINNIGVALRATTSGN